MQNIGYAHNSLHKLCKPIFLSIDCISINKQDKKVTWTTKILKGGIDFCHKSYQTLKILRQEAAWEGLKND